MGAAFAEFGIDVPLIAVTPLGCVKGREVFEGRGRGLVHTYACQEPAEVTGACLNPHHTHFVFVDSGKEAPAAWGAEIALRANLEATYSMSKGVPLVLLVVQGGPGTLATVHSALENHTRVVVLEESGGEIETSSGAVESFDGAAAQ